MPRRGSKAQPLLPTAIFNQRYTNIFSQLQVLDTLSDDELVLLAQNINLILPSGKGSLLRSLAQYYSLNAKENYHSKFKEAISLLAPVSIDMAALEKFIFTGSVNLLEQLRLSFLADDWENPGASNLGTISQILLEPFKDKWSLLQLIAKSYPARVPELLYLLSSIGLAPNVCMQVLLYERDPDKELLIGRLWRQLPAEFYHSEQSPEIMQNFNELVLNGLLLPLNLLTAKKGSREAIKCNLQWPISVKLLMHCYPAKFPAWVAWVRQNYPEKLAEVYLLIVPYFPTVLDNLEDKTLQSQYVLECITKFSAMPDGWGILHKIFTHATAFTDTVIGFIEQNNDYMQGFFTSVAHQLVIRFLLEKRIVDNNLFDDLLGTINGKDELKTKFTSLEQVFPSSVLEVVSLLQSGEHEPLRLMNTIAGTINLYQELLAQSSPPVWQLSILQSWILHMTETIPLTMDVVERACRELNIPWPQDVTFDAPHVSLFYMLCGKMKLNDKHRVLQKLYNLFFVSEHELKHAKGNPLIGRVLNALIQCSKTTGHESELKSIVYTSRILPPGTKLKLLYVLQVKAGKILDRVVCNDITKTSMHLDKRESGLLLDLKTSALYDWLNRCYLSENAYQKLVEKNAQFDVIGHIRCRPDLNERVANAKIILFEPTHPLACFFRKMLTESSSSKPAGLDENIAVVCYEILQKAKYLFSLEESKQLDEWGLSTSEIALSTPVRACVSEPLAVNSRFHKMNKGTNDDIHVREPSRFVLS